MIKHPYKMTSVHVGPVKRPNLLFLGNSMFVKFMFSCVGQLTVELFFIDFFLVIIRNAKSIDSALKFTKYIHVFNELRNNIRP